MKKCLSIILCLVTLLSLFANVSFPVSSAEKLIVHSASDVAIPQRGDADFATTGATTGVTKGDTGDCTWEVVDKTLTISGSGRMKNYSSFYYGERAQYRYTNAPWNGTGFTKVVIEDGVTTIGDCAFTGLYFDSISLPDTLISIGSNAFLGCGGLTSITIPDSVESIEFQSFSKTGLTSVTIPDSITSISTNCFSDSKRLESVIIPESVISIHASAFLNCTSLDNITIPDGVSHIGKDAFHNTAWYNNQPDGLVYIGRFSYAYKGTMPVNTSIELQVGTRRIVDGAFSGCTGLISVTIPDSVEKIGDYAFFGCTGLISVTIPDSVEKIGDYAFSGCTGLTTITIPNSVENIGYGAFSDCSESLIIICYPNSTAYNYATNNKITINTLSDTVWSLSDDGVLTISGKGEMSNYSFSHNVNPDGSVPIKSTAPWGGRNVKSVIIEDGVTSIGTYAFYGCFNLSNVTIPDSVTKISDRAFTYCEKLKSVTIPDSVTSIGDYAFHGASSLERISLSDNVTFLGEFAFFDTAWYNNQPDGLVYIGRIACDYKGTMPANTTINIKDGTKVIASKALCYESCLAKVTIPNGLVSIGNNAFYGCINLKSITIPGSVTFIGERALGYYTYYYGTHHSDENRKLKDFTIYGYQGGVAEQYANGNKFTFVSLGNDPPEPPTDPPTDEPAKIICGDANGDNDVTISDATRVQSWLAELCDMNGEARTGAALTVDEVKAADADGNGDVTIMDATAIQRYIAELPTNDNIGKIV